MIGQYTQHILISQQEKKIYLAKRERIKLYVTLRKERKF